MYTVKTDQITEYETGTFTFFDGSKIDIDLCSGLLFHTKQTKKVTKTNFMKNRYTKIVEPTTTFASALCSVIDMQATYNESEFLTICFEINTKLKNRK